MKTSDIIVGLDIGTTKIAAIVGRMNELGKIEILGHGKTESIGVKRGVVSNNRGWRPVLFLVLPEVLWSRLTLPKKS